MSISKVNPLVPRYSCRHIKMLKQELNMLKSCRNTLNNNTCEKILTVRIQSGRLFWLNYTLLVVYKFEGHGMFLHVMCLKTDKCIFASTQNWALIRHLQFPGSRGQCSPQASLATLISHTCSTTSMPVPLGDPSLRISLRLWPTCLPCTLLFPSCSPSFKLSFFFIPREYLKLLHSESSTAVSFKFDWLKA